LKGYLSVTGSLNKISYGILSVTERVFYKTHNPKREGKAMNMIEELKGTLRMEIRSNSKELEYLEAVLQKKDLELLHSLLTKHLGSAAKESGEEKNLPKEIEKLVDSLGGLRKEQSFFYRQEGQHILYAAIWPWQSNPDKITLKSGVSKLVLEDR
jgi:hypothetical protein